MKLNVILFTTIVVLLSGTCASTGTKFTYKSINSYESCQNKEGIWYNDQCWKDFQEDESLSESEVDDYVNAAMAAIESSKMRVDDVRYPVHTTIAIPIENEKVLFVIVYRIDNDFETALFTPELEYMSEGAVFQVSGEFYDGNAWLNGLSQSTALASSEVRVQVHVLETGLDIEFDGTWEFQDGRDSKKFNIRINETLITAGNSVLEIKGDEAWLSGELGTVTYAQIRNLAENHPQIKTIVMKQIKGSLNDMINMHTGRLIRKHGFTTKVLSDSNIASGGVDLFCAGKERIVEQGAMIGVHSWCCVDVGEDEFTAIDVPEKHPAHRPQLDYFTSMLGKDIGPKFYFYTLNAAAFEDVHYMTDEEIHDWGIASRFIPKK